MKIIVVRIYKLGIVSSRLQQHLLQPFSHLKNKSNEYPSPKDKWHASEKTGYIKGRPDWNGQASLGELNPL